MFTYDERRTLGIIMEKLRAELPKAQAEAEEAEEARNLAGDYYETMHTNFAWDVYTEESKRYHDLNDKANSLEWMLNHLDRFMEELEFIDWLHV